MQRGNRFTKFDDIMEVDKNHHVFSSDVDITIGDQPPDFEIANFIAMDPPRHDQQRNAVVPVVAPRNLMKLEPVIRARLVSNLRFARGQAPSDTDTGAEETTTPSSTAPTD